MNDASPFNDFVPYKNGVAEDFDASNRHRGEVQSVSDWIVFIVGACVVVGAVLFG